MRAASARTRAQRGKGAAGPAPRASRFGANLQFSARAAAASMAPPRPQVSAPGPAAGLHIAAAADSGEPLAPAAAPLALRGLANLGEPD